MVYLNKFHKIPMDVIIERNYIENKKEEEK